MNDTDQFSDREIIALTAWGEARGLGSEGMQATINTGCNRVQSGITWWGKTLREVFLKPWQYSCWNATDPNRPKLLSVDAFNPKYSIALGLADTALSGQLDDLTNQADSYYDDRMPSMPVWAHGLAPCFIYDTQRYFKTVEWAKDLNDQSPST